MAIIAVTEILHDDAEVTLSNTEGQRIAVTRRFRVQTDANTDPLAVATSCGVQIGQAYASPHGLGVVPGLVCKSLKPKLMAKAESDDRWWEVVARFETQDREQQQQQGGDVNPLLLPPEIRGGSEEYERPLIKDGKGKDLQTSAGEKFNPPILWPESRQTFTISRNERSINFDRLQQFSGSVNRNQWWLFKAYRCMMGAITWEAKWWGNFRYFTVNYPIRISNDKDGWRVWPLDIGTVYLDGGQQRKAIDEKGNTYLRTFKLDGNGGKLADQTAPAKVLKNFETPKLISWSSLRLP